MAGAIVLNPTHAKVGTSVLITGTGFTAADTMSFTFGGVTIVPTEAPIVVNGDGTLPTCHIVIPASVQGIHAVIATDAHAVSGSANFTTDSGISLSPSTQQIGGSVTVTGTGFAPTSAVTITIGGITVTGITTNASGGFSQAETVPTLASGSQTVSATDAATNNATATLTVSAPTAIATPNNGIVGSTTTITGANYIPSHSLTVTNIDGTTSMVTSDSSGNIPAGVILTIPDATHGSHNITVTDGTNTGTVAFTVNSSLSLNPTSGKIGTTCVVTARGLAPTSAITIDFAGTSVTPGGSPTTDADGDYSGTITIPTKASGARTVTVTDASANAPTATFTVTAPSITLTPATGPVGTLVTITGTGFIPSKSLTITNVDGSTTSVTSDGSGNIPAGTTIMIETSPQGNNNVTVGDGTNTATGVFAITPKITIDPTTATPGSAILITGSGFAASNTVTIQLDGVTQTTIPATVTSDDDGAFTAEVELSSSITLGSHTILSTDASSNSASSTFTISSTQNLTDVNNDFKNVRSYQYVDPTDFPVEDDNYVKVTIVDVRNVVNMLMTIYCSDPSHGLTYSTYGIMHESDSIVPPIDTAGLKKWTEIDTDVPVASTAVSTKSYTNQLYSYFLILSKRTTSAQNSAGQLSLKVTRHS